jgi:hypothetical protein
MGDHLPSMYIKALCPNKTTSSVTYVTTTAILPWINASNTSSRGLPTHEQAKTHQPHMPSDKSEGFAPVLVGHD